jgi:predicted lipoprotein with Yx(FWY)xxD motif
MRVITFCDDSLRRSRTKRPPLWQFHAGSVQANGRCNFPEGMRLVSPCFKAGVLWRGGDKRTFLSVIALMMMMVVISGCASGASVPTTTQNPSTGSTTQAAIPTVFSSENVVVKTANAIVSNKSESILTDTNGRTLYYFTPVILHKVACTTDCIDTWPPLLFKGTGTVNANTKLSGDLTTDTTPNGNQIAYNAHYLYTYTGDSAPGDTKGDGVGNKWYVATPNLTQNQSSSQTTTGY